MLARALRRGPGLLLATLCLAAFVCSSAFADEPKTYSPPEGVYTEPPDGSLPECPASPEPLPEGEPEGEGEEAPSPVDPVVVELRRQRIEAVEACEALVDRGDRQLRRLWWVVAQLVETRDQLQAANGRLSELSGALCDPCDVRVVGDPLPVVDAASQEYTDQIVSATDASGEASKAGLWFVAALVLIGFVGYALYKVFFFWKEEI